MFSLQYVIASIDLVAINGRFIGYGPIEEKEALHQQLNFWQSSSKGLYGFCTSYQYT